MEGDEAPRFTSRAKIVSTARRFRCWKCHGAIARGEETLRRLEVGTGKEFFSHYPACPEEVREELVTTDRECPCSRCHRMIPAGSQAVRATGNVLDRWENPIEVEIFYHYPSCPERGRCVRYNKRGEMSV